MTEPLHVDEVPAEEPVGPEAFDVADDDALAALDLIAEKPEPWRRWLAWLFRRPEPVAEDVADPLDELVDRIAAGGPQALVEVFAEVGRLLRATPAQQPGSLVPPWPWTPEQRAHLNAVLWEGERRKIERRVAQMTARPQVPAALYGLPGIPGGNEADQTAAVLRDLIGLTNHHY